MQKIHYFGHCGRFNIKILIMSFEYMTAALFLWKIHMIKNLAYFFCKNELDNIFSLKKHVNICIC